MAEIKPIPVGVLLFPGVSLLSVAGVRSACHAANELLGQTCYPLAMYSLGGNDVLTQCGARLATSPLPRDRDDDLLILLADDPLDSSLSDVLRPLLSPQRKVGAGGTAPLLLAELGMLRGYRAVVSWHCLGDASNRFPDTVFSSAVFEIDRDRLTCGGGTTTLDLMLAWLTQRHGVGFGAELAAALGVERLRHSDEKQPMPATAQPVIGSARIKEALALMEANLGEPLQTEDIARLVGVSRRQLERLFRQHMETLPSRYYLELRLRHARRQLKQTTQSILQIGLACGFASGPHFSTAYRSFFGHTPREERARLRMPRSGSTDAVEDTTHD